MTTGDGKGVILRREAMLVLVIVLGAIASRRFCDNRSADVEPIVAATRSGRCIRPSITSTAASG